MTVDFTSVKGCCSRCSTFFSYFRIILKKFNILQKSKIYKYRGKS
nr:MAG TPA: hypothetical protein [Caudoviricetes sp.]